MIITSRPAFLVRAQNMAQQEFFVKPHDKIRLVEARDMIRNNPYASGVGGVYCGDNLTVLQELDATRGAAVDSEPAHPRHRPIDPHRDGQDGR